MVKNQSQMIKWFILIMAFVLISQGGLAGFTLMSGYPAYTTGYEGAHARYYGVRHDSKVYTQGLWDTTFRWDNPTAQGQSWKEGNTPPLAGEMTSVFIPTETVGYQPGWIPSEWLLDATRTRNPLDSYEWQIKDTDETTFYHMELWRLKWYFSISSEPQNDGDIPAHEPETTFANPRSSLLDTEVWFEFNLRPVWYFNGTDRAYFAIASLRLTEIALGGKLQDGKTAAEPNSRCRVTPMSESSILPVYYAGFGTSRAEKTAYSYQGQELNPDLFTNTVYSYFTLNDFGVSAWWDWGWFWKADTVTVGLDMDVFVVGEWKVKDIQNLPNEYGRTAKTGGTGFGLGALISDFLGSPGGRLWLLIFVGAAVLLVLALFAPWVLISLSALFGGRKGRG